jgi:hypothetical protein
MPQSVEMQNIRGLDIDKTVKGFAEVEYVFKQYCTVSSMAGDSLRWYQETAGDLTATAPSVVANVSPLSQFPTLEKTWVRQTSYVRKYAAEGFISMEDMKSADIDVLARTLRALTRAVVKQVDTRIWDIMTSNRTFLGASNQVNSAGWFGAGTDIVNELLQAKRLIYENDYNPEGAILFINPLTNQNMLKWLISTKGSSIPNFSSNKVKSGVVMNILGLDVVVSNNVTTSGAAVVIPNVACTWKTYTDTTSAAIEEKGVGTKLRVWELGEAILTDPKAVCYLSGV